MRMLGTTRMSTGIVVALLGAFCCCPDSTNSTNAQELARQFEAPVFLKVGQAPLNETGEMMYPSPVIFDIDQDGVDELVVGTIFGGVYCCENKNAGQPGDPVWESPSQVNTADGEPIDLNNW